MLINQRQNGYAYQASIRSRMKQLLRLMLLLVFFFFIICNVKWNRMKRVRAATTTNAQFSIYIELNHALQSEQS